MRRIAILCFLCLGLAALPARAAHTQVRLLLPASMARPGDTILAGVDLKMDPGWHTYWKNPGDSGQATVIQWQLPPGVNAGETQWPLPEKLPPAEVTTYGYSNEVVLAVPLTFATNLPPGPILLRAQVSWLECEQVCVPGKAEVDATLNLASRTEVSADAGLIQTWADRVPKAFSGSALQAWWTKTQLADTRTLTLQFGGQRKPDGVDFFPGPDDSLEVPGLTQWGINPGNGEVWLQKSVKKLSGDWPGRMSGVLVLEQGASRIGYETAPEISTGAPPGLGASLTENFPVAGQQPLGRMLLFAFIGGLILNIMPCVLPVIALKILGFVGEAQSSPRRVRVLGLIYAIGVLVSFLALAAVVLGVKAAGHHAGWGMQFGSPVFVVCLTTLVLLVALNLFGVFEVALGGHALDAAGKLASRHGPAGAFFNGVLATALATPCTAPFLSIALGFAFAQGALVVLVIFLAAGAGLASPYVLLSWHPAWLKFLPKPGAWMEKFKIAMGFPMLATVVWLFNVASSSYGKNVLWLGIFLIFVALAAWVYGEFVQRGRRGRTAARLVTLLLLISGYGLALERELDWRNALPPGPSSGSLKESADGIDWQVWSPAAVAEARAAGRPVLVDFTADWCLTCQVNKKTSIDIPSVRAKLKELNTVALLGDYTHFPESITGELNHYARAGVPLVLVYPKTSDAPAIVLPEVLTPNIVLNALNRAAQ